MRDEFDLEELDNNKNEDFTNKDKFNNVLAYIPFLNIWLLFVEKQWTKKENMRYNRQWITLFLLYVILFFAFSILSFKLSFILTLLYFSSVIFFAAKAYNWIYVEIEFIEKIMAQFENKVNEKKSKNDKDSNENTL